MKIFVQILLKFVFLFVDLNGAHFSYSAFWALMEGLLNTSLGGVEVLIVPRYLLSHFLHAFDGGLFESFGLLLAVFGVTSQTEEAINVVFDDFLLDHVVEFILMLCL